MNSLGQPRPLRRLPAPRYPSRLDLPAASSPPPPAWLDLKAATAAALIAVSLAGCHSADSPPAARPGAAAPLFLHGEGRGVVGCLVAAPPAFISEEEAKLVIEEELAKAGLRFAPAARGDGLALRHDAIDPGRRVAWEYVSERDWARSNPPDEERPSAYEVDLHRAAENYRAVAAGLNLEYFVATFYDPSFVGDPAGLTREELWELPYFPGGRGASEKVQAFHEATNRQARELLRRQARDFIDWLKGQGAI